jgi:hypothetical protein
LGVLSLRLPHSHGLNYVLVLFDQKWLHSALFEAPPHLICYLDSKCPTISKSGVEDLSPMIETVPELVAQNLKMLLKEDSKKRHEQNRGASGEVFLEHCVSVLFLGPKDTVWTWPSTA